MTTFKKKMEVKEIVVEKNPSKLDIIVPPVISRKSCIEVNAEPVHSNEELCTVKKR